MSSASVNGDTKLCSKDTYPELPLSPEKSEELLDYARDWALANGFLMRRSEDKTRSDYAQLCPFVLLPTRLPRHCYDQAIAVQQDMNQMYFAAAADPDFVKGALREVVETDEFTRKQLELYETVMSEGLQQNTVLQIQRSDYMCHSPDQSQANATIKQIEVNNIASSFSALASKCSVMHGAVLRYLGYDTKHVSKHLITHNAALDTVAGGIAQAWKAYNKRASVILVVVEEGNQNISDHRHTEYVVNHMTDECASFLRLTLTQCQQRLRMHESSKVLLDVLTNQEIAVVYFRAGYVPQHYPSDNEWKARLIIERSQAIKCPWIGLQLVNTKKVQQMLAQPGQVEKYLAPFYKNDAEGLEASSLRVRDTFAGMWGLDIGDPATDKAVQDAKLHPEKYVLKPQLEGGGSNTYGADIPKLLDKLSDKERAAYILMERIHPLESKNYLVRSGSSNQSTLYDVISELGVYGYLLGDVSQLRVQSNVAGGHVLRTKTVNTDEGGIMAGASCIDSPYLVAAND